MKGINDSAVAAAIQGTCLSKFHPTIEDKKCELREMSAEELANITGESQITSVTSQPYFTARLYNGNEHRSIEQITVSISGDNMTQPQIYELFMSHHIPPRSSGNPGISIAFLPGKNFKWRIESAKTCKYQFIPLK
jgi:hypothetical protein